MVFFDDGQRKPRILGHAARFARVEGEVRAEDFLEGGFFGGGGMQMRNADTDTVECLPHPPVRARDHSSPYEAPWEA